MDFRKQRLSISEAKQMDLVDYLSGLGYQPSKIRHADYWYHSPLRNEKTPSFKVNRKLNLWYDHGLGKGGNLIDFAILYHDCTVGEFMQKINDHFSFHPPFVIHPEKHAREDKNVSAISVIGEYMISSFSLASYLKERRIPLEIAYRYCREVRYKIRDKIYYGIGFKNDSGGYEIRNPHFKISSSPKDIITIKNGSKSIFVFEGFFDFLSFMTIHKNLHEHETDFLILNSVSFFEKARPFMEQHEAIHLYLDRDAAGQTCIQHALTLSNQYKDESHLYRNHKDLNDWLVNFGKPQKRNQKQKPL